MLWKRLVLLGIVFCCCSSCSEEPRIYPRLYAPPALLENPSSQAAGKSMFQRYCATCHGKLDEGVNPAASDLIPRPPDFWESRYAHKDPGYLFWRIRTGRTQEPFRSRGSVMPPFEAHFDEQQTWYLVAYLKVRAGRGN